MTLLPDLSESQKINLNIITLNTAINDLQHTVKDHQEILVEGKDGELPLRELVRSHSQFIGEIRYWTKFVFGALMLQTIAFLVGIVVAIIRFLPVLESLAK